MILVLYLNLTNYRRCKCCACQKEFSNGTNDRSQMTSEISRNIFTNVCVRTFPSVITRNWYIRVFPFFSPEWTTCIGSFTRGCRRSTASSTRITGGSAATSCPILTPTCHRNCHRTRPARARIPRRRARLAVMTATRSQSWRESPGRWVRIVWTIPSPYRMSPRTISDQEAFPRWIRKRLTSAV